MGEDMMRHGLCGSFCNVKLRKKNDKSDGISSQGAIVYHRFGDLRNLLLVYDSKENCCAFLCRNATRVVFTGTFVSLCPIWHGSRNFDRCCQSSLPLYCSTDDSLGSNLLAVSAQT